MADSQKLLQCIEADQLERSEPNEVPEVPATMKPECAKAPKLSVPKDNSLTDPRTIA